MSAILLLRNVHRSIALPCSVVRPVLGCFYHTYKGVYGYRPKQTEGDSKFNSDNNSALNQGQWVCYSYIVFICYVQISVNLLYANWLVKTMSLCKVLVHFNHETRGNIVIQLPTARFK